MSSTEFQVGDGVDAAMALVQQLMIELDIGDEAQRAIVTRAIAGSSKPGVQAFLRHSYRDLLK